MTFNKEKHRRTRQLLGLFLSGFAVLLLLKHSDVAIPEWVFSFPTFLLSLGLFICLKDLFRNPFGWTMLILGSLLLIKKIYITEDIPYKEYIWPVILLLIGLKLLFGKHRGTKFKKGCPPPCFGKISKEGKDIPSEEENDDYINARLMFSAMKKKYLSKQFKGGVINIVMGGAEIDLSQCDFDLNENAIIHINQVMGGTKLIIPANWSLIVDIDNILSGVEDKRDISRVFDNLEQKTLTIKGSSILGGIEIKNF